MDFYVSVTKKIVDITSLLRQVHRLLAASKKFSNFDVIYTARVPIVKCRHVESGFPCDINFTNNVGVYKSRIMAHLFRFDPRIHKLVILIKFWMKCHNLIAPRSINSYAFLCLVIFYLQQLDVPLLPPIEVFQRDVPHFAVGAANLSFNFTLPNTLTKNVDGILTLLHGFFEFYAKFDFAKQFISPLHGRSFPRENFEKRFPHHFARYRETLKLIPTAEPMRFGKPINIQDPFEICRSIPGKLNGLYYETFRDALTNAAQIFSGYLTTAGGSKELLLALFSNKPTESSADFFVLKGNGKRTLNVTIKATEKEIVEIQKYLKRKYPNESPSNKEIEELWVKLCIFFLKEMLRDIFAFHHQKQTSTESDFSKSFDMIADNYVFVHRKPMKLPVPRIDTEIKRTKRKEKKIRKAGGCQQSPMQINCNIWANLEDNSTVFVDFVDDGTNPIINAFHVQFCKRARLLIYGYFENREFEIVVVELGASVASIQEKDIEPMNLHPSNEHTAK